MPYLSFFFICSILLFPVCSDQGVVHNNGPTEHLTIFFVNDQHGRIDHFSKIKYIVDQEKQQTNVLVACSGDMFSGNPIVDNYPEKGFPMIDLMNQTGFDISVLGNHEFDYGEATLKARMEQAKFEWVCANVDMSNTQIPQPQAFKTLTTGNLKVTFLGLVETNGSQNKTIPLTHPWKVQNISFSRPESIVGQYAAIKEQENADLYIALTHLGHDAWNQAYLGDFDLAMKFPYFDAIIGGHTNQLLDTVVNFIPVFQAGHNLSHLGKIKFKVQNKKVISYNYELIDLNTFPDFDPELKATIEVFNNSMPELDDAIGHSEIFHTFRKVGCFYTDALKRQMKVDFAIQNSGGVRDDLDEGDILKKEIYAISPFYNGTIVYEMTVGEIKQLLKESTSGFYYSGLNLEQIGQEIVVRDSSGKVLEDSYSLTLGTNDYIPAVDNEFFPASGILQDLTDAETIINYLQANPEPVNYPTCERYFKFQ